MKKTAQENEEGLDIDDYSGKKDMFGLGDSYYQSINEKLLKALKAMVWIAHQSMTKEMMEESHRYFEMANEAINEAENIENKSIASGIKMKKTARLIKDHVEGKKTIRSNKIMNKVASVLEQKGYKAPFNLKKIAV